jgi:hypothetical protein
MAAAIAINNFRTITHQASTGTPTVVYTAPTGYTAVFLLDQAANIGPQTKTISFYHKRGAVTTEVVLDLPIAAGDTLNLLPGKLVLETGDAIAVSANTTTDIKFIASVLETSNF